MCSNEMLSSATTHTSTRQQSAAVLPVRSAAMGNPRRCDEPAVDLLCTDTGSVV